MARLVTSEDNAVEPRISPREFLALTYEEQIELINKWRERRENRVSKQKSKRETTTLDTLLDTLEDF